MSSSGLQNHNFSNDAVAAHFCTIQPSKGYDEIRKRFIEYASEKNTSLEITEVDYMLQCFVNDGLLDSGGFTISGICIFHLASQLNDVKPQVIQFLHDINTGPRTAEQAAQIKKKLESISEESITAVGGACGMMSITEGSSAAREVVRSYLKKSELNADTFANLKIGCVINLAQEAIDFGHVTMQVNSSDIQYYYEESCMNNSGLPLSQGSNWRDYGSLTALGAQDLADRLLFGEGGMFTEVTKIALLGQGHKLFVESERKKNKKDGFIGRLITRMKG